MNVGSQILYFAKEQGIRVTTLESELEVSKSYFRNTKNVSVDVLIKFMEKHPEVSLEWLLYGKGEMIKSEDPIPNGRNRITVMDGKVSEKIYPMSTFELYDLDVSAGFSRLFSDDGGSSLGTISIPNMPKCDGAVKVVGDSMAPLLKSGDIIAFRKLSSLESVLYGEMYIIQIEHESDLSVVVKYVKKSEKGDDYLNLVSHNSDYDPIDVKKDCITAIARVIISIRQCSVM